MFSKTNRPNELGGDGREINASPSIISANLHVVGNLKTEGEVQVDGIVEGDVAGRTLAVGEKAQITGEIMADEVMVRGTVHGRIRARQVELAKTAKVIGDILHDVLAIESGAYIEGHCKRLEKNRDVSTTPMGVVPGEQPTQRQPDAAGRAEPTPLAAAERKAPVPTPVRGADAGQTSPTLADTGAGQRAEKRSPQAASGS